MKTLIARSAIWLACLLSPAPLAAQEPRREPPVDLAELDGEWKVDYWDGALDTVEGTARIDAAGGRAEVVYRHPRSGKEYTLRSTSLRFDGGSLTIALEGRSPDSFQEDGTGAPEFAQVIEEPAPEFTVRRGDNTATLSLKPLQETDQGKTTIELKVTKDLLSGWWRYRSHPFIGRAADGWGRSGILAERDGSVWTTGPESWRRPQPVVYGALPLEDQLAFRMGSDGTALMHHPYPFGAGARAPTGKARLLFVFGKDLPRDHGRRIRIDAVDPGVTYLVIARRSDSGSAYYAGLFADGWKKLAEHLPPGTPASSETLDAVIVRAELQPAAVPGLNTFKLEDQEVGWLLQFGDNTARLRVVRPVRNAFEPTGFLFPGELVRIELETAHPLPVATIPVLVGVDGKPLLIGDGEGIPARREASDPRIYRTDYIYLPPARGAAPALDLRAGRGLLAIPVRQGSRITAVLGRPDVISVPPAMAQATVFEMPGDTAVGGAWDAWLNEAAACAGATGTGARLEQSEARTIRERLIGNTLIDTLSGPSSSARRDIPTKLEAKVSVGQHTAMLLLRDTFVRLLLRTRSEFARVQTDDEILAFRRHMEPLVRQAATPLGRVPVPSLDRVGRTDFIWTFEQSILAKIHDRKIDEVERWAIGATRDAIAKYLAAIDAAIAKAQAIETCAVEKLLRLTGKGFEPVALVAKSKLMLQSGSTSLWSPDFRARAWTDTVAILGAQLEIQDRVGEEDTHDTQAAVAIATLPVAIVGGPLGSMGAVMATFLVDVFDIFFATYTEVTAKWAQDAEVQFAMGAADVLGMQRLNKARAQQRSWSTVFVRLGFVVAPAGAGIYFDIPDLYRAFRQVARYAKARRGRLAVAAMNDLPSASTGGNLARGARAAIEEALQEAHADPAVAAARRDAARGKLDEILASAESSPPPGVRLDGLARATSETADDIGAFLDEIESSALRSALDEDSLTAALRQFYPDGKPPWAGAFRADTVDLVRKHAIWRPDLRRILEAAPARLAALLQAAGERGMYARQVMLSEPGLDDINAFEQRVSALLERRSTPQGPEVYKQARDAAVMRELKRQGWYAKMDPHFRARTSNADRRAMRLFIRDPDGRVGVLARSYENGVYTMDVAFRDAGPGWSGLNIERKIASVRSPTGFSILEETPPGPIRGKIDVPAPGGTQPSMAFFSRRMMNWFGIPYGSADGIKKAKLSTVLNARTIVQVNWFKETYYPLTSWDDIPADELSEFLQATFSGRYGAENLAFAGYKVTAARLVGTGPKPRLLGSFEDNFDVALRAGEADAALKARRTTEFTEFLARHGLTPESQGISGFTIELDVEPWLP